MTILKKIAVVVALLLVGNTAAWSQCTNWNEIAKKGEAEDAHVVYRPYLKDKTVAEVTALAESDFNLAFANWQKAYTLAPAADGQRPTHYIDGITLYQAKIAKTEDVAQKEAFAKVIQGLYDEYLQCYPDDRKLILGRKAFDMFYSYGYGYTLETLEAVKLAIDEAGNDAEYLLLDPTGLLLVYLYEDKQIDKATVQYLYNKASAFANHNIEKGHPYKAYYESGKANMDAAIEKIASEVFDCGYFRNSLLPKYEENRNSWEAVNYVWQKLLSEGCEETDPALAPLKADYDRLYAVRKDSLDIVRRKEDPCFDGSKLQEEGKYQEALARYQECVDSTTDPEMKAQILYSMASIQTWQLGQYGTAQSNAQRAASIKSGWGKPYILMGDIISKRSSACDDWNRRLAAIAAIDKYSYARSIDSSVSDDAGSRIGRLSGSLPSREDGFMRKTSEGQSVTIPCIGETVKVRFRD
ncbi:MAG: hypothetical protein DA408_12805 [Bacteroidetes bacterium]|nr:MAG: hypothetical protein C7N36_20545 [Bacteroidota bacterium]PTM11809.1 MAG: hypothetical protein DA408_12805 [Bacteroidota bacterium]